jgi:hypothetical protein
VRGLSFSGGNIISFSPNLVSEYKQPVVNGKKKQNISKRMRRILVDKLKYLETEVDDLEPQIAIVLIERGLSRPKKGVPSSWLKSHARQQEFGDHLLAILRNFSSSTVQILKFGQSVVVPLLPFAAVGFIAFFQQNLLMSIGEIIAQNIGTMKSRAIDFFLFNEVEDEDQVQSMNDLIIDRSEQEEDNVRRRVVGTIPMPTFSLKDNALTEKMRVNLYDYDKVTRSSIWNNLNLRIAGWCKQFE